MLRTLHPVINLTIELCINLQYNAYVMDPNPGNKKRVIVRCSVNLPLRSGGGVAGLYQITLRQSICHPGEGTAAVLQLGERYTDRDG